MTKRAQPDERSPWRQAVKRSTLSDAVKATLLAHAQTRDWAVHDDEANTHSITRARLAAARHKGERTLDDHLSAAIAAGYLTLHSRGYNGNTAVYHYTTPRRPSGCAECDPGSTTGETFSPPDGDRLSRWREDILARSGETDAE